MPIALASSEQNSTLWPPNGAFRLRRGSGGRRRQAAAGKTREALSFLSLSAVRPAKGPPDLSQNRPHSAARPSAHTGFLPPLTAKPSEGEDVATRVRKATKHSERGTQTRAATDRGKLIKTRRRAVVLIQVRLFAIAS